MQDILLDRIGKDMAAYLEEIIADIQKRFNHKQAIPEVLKLLSKHNLWLTLEKCNFLRSKAKYLGLIISSNKIQMDSTKVKAVAEFP